MHNGSVMLSLIDIIRRESNPLAPLPTDIDAQLRVLPGIKCVVFDVYGTLMVSGVGDISHSSVDDRKQAIFKLFEQMGIPLKQELAEPGVELNAIIQAHQDRSRQTGIAYPEVDIREVWEDFVKEYTDLATTTHDLIAELAVRFELSVNPTWPMPHLESTLETLREKGIRLGIVSNAQFFTPLLFDAYCQQPFDSLGFESDLCQWSYHFREAKPSMRMYRIEAMTLEAKYGILEDEVLYVGNDLLNDIVPASKVGFKTALFAGDKRSLRLREGDERVHGITPDLMVTSLDQLIACVGA